MKRYTPGDEALLRYVRNKPADVIVPTRVVQDDDQALILYVAVGTPWKGQATREGKPITRQTPFLERERMIAGLADSHWHTHHVIKIMKPGRMSAIWLMWREADWTLASYYGNLQAPCSRTRLGFDTADYLLDVAIDADLNCSWKDEDEWEAAWEHGLLDRDLLTQVRAEGERVMEDVAARRWPFDRSLESWRPDPGWEVPQMPEDWADELQFPED